MLAATARCCADHMYLADTRPRRSAGSCISAPGSLVLSERVQVLSTDIDLLHPPAELEKQKHKTKRLVQSPNSFFMDVKCQGCFQM